MEGLKIPTIGSIVRFVILWITVTFLVKLLVPAEWRSKLFGLN